MITEIGIKIENNRIQDIKTRIVSFNKQVLKEEGFMYLKLDIDKCNIHKLNYLEKLINTNSDSALDYIYTLSRTNSQTLNILETESHGFARKTSAYLIRNKHMLLIDCNDYTYTEINRLNLLDGIKTLIVYITQNSIDYISGLPYLIKKCEEIGIELNITTHHDNALKLETILKLLGTQVSVSGLIKRTIKVDHDSYISLKTIRIDNKNDLCCSALDITLPSRKIIYTGQIDTYIGLLVDVSKHNEIYTDCTDTKDSSHVNIADLDRILGPAIRNKIYCIGIDASPKKINSLGFNHITIK